MQHTPTDFLRAAGKTAEHFGFRTIENLKKEPACKNSTNSIPHTVDKDEITIDVRSGLFGKSVALYCEENLNALNAPVLLYHHHEVPETGDTAVTFNIFNVQKSIAEAILIQASRALLLDLGHTDHLVRINSLGDNESTVRYGREVTNFLKRRLDHMPAEARELMKEHSLLALMHLVDIGHDLAFKSPNPLEYLSDQSRKHFREIIEYLDMSDTPYEIDPKMLGHHECYSDALFTIDTLMEDGSEAPLSVRGGRYDELVYRKTKTRTPATGAVLILKGSKFPTRIPRNKESVPSVYLVQLGFGPKVRSLLLIDNLRKAGIPVFHDLTSDSLSTQLRDAEARGVKYTIIVGQKEFVEQSVILRDMAARNQEHIPQSELVKKLRRHIQVVA